jgi:hypothetical protein
LNTLLIGKTSNLYPVLFLTGGAKIGKSPYPSLQLSYDIQPHGDQESRWVHASLDEVDKSFELAKQVINKNWPAEFARITRINSVQMEIYTGNTDWDNAIYLSQILAYQLFLQPTAYCNLPSFVSARKMDQGFSLSGDGTDYNYLWNGQSLLDTHYLTNLLLPSSPQLIKSLLNNFLDIQTPTGEIDLKPGLAAQRSHLLATPLLADIVLRLFECCEDYDYLKSVYPKLLSFFLSWFTISHDRDEDRIPEWEQPIQTGFEDHPFFSLQNKWSSRVDISTIESPGLSSYLYRECISLTKIAKHINHTNDLILLESYADMLKAMVDKSWSEQYACYLHRDRDSHVASLGEYLGTIHGAGIINIHKEFNQPVRPVLYFESQQEITHPTKIYIHGIGTTGVHRVEHIPAGKIHWQHQFGSVTSAYVYNSLERIEINGIHPDDQVTVNTVDLTCMDQTLLLPLWAGIPLQERAKILINLTIMNKKKFLGPHGLRSWIELSGINEIPENIYGIHIPWNTLIMEGLMQYGERAKAAELFMRLMKPMCMALQAEISLNKTYHIETGKSQGIQNSISGLVPLGLFLEILGLKIYNPSTIEISGNNPFPWPVTVKYQGLTIIKQVKKTMVTFPDGQRLTIDNDQFRRISCNRKNS